MANKQQSLLNAGKSIRERLWEELDRIMDILMVEDEPDADEYYYQTVELFEDEKFKADVRQWGEHRGNAQGVAYAIAMMVNSYAPNVPDVKREAMERWEERNA